MFLYSFPAFRLPAIVFFAFIFLIPNGFSQVSKHGNIWHFGNRAGVDFSTGQPVKLTNIEVDSYEGCAVYCDADGQVLLYTNGGGFGPNANNGPREGIIWNRNQTQMYNMGTTEGGGYSAAQSALILPKPGSDNLYYVFTMDHAPSLDIPGANRGLSYFEVDMTLNGGLGGVVQANVPVFRPAAESLTAIPNATGSGFWVIAIDRDSRDFAVVPVTNTGVGTPVIRPRNSNSENVLVTKASPNGKFLCADSELYAFDQTTGNLTFLESVTTSNYSFSFSPGSRYLYAFESDASFKILRYDLSANEINKSGELVTTDTVVSFAGLMQLGPDGHIYLIEQLEEDFLQPIPPMSLSVIRCPDSETPEVERAIMKFETDPDNAGGLFTSLPNFADYIFASPEADIRIEATTAVDSCSPFPLKLQAKVTGLGYIQWSNGKMSDTLVVNESGTYIASFITNCGVVRDTFLIEETTKADCCHPVIPNAFTPNDDGVNDKFGVKLNYCEVEILEFSVYSRWGELMFQAVEPTDRWDGTTLNGTEAPSDIYVYVARYKVGDEAEEKFEKGDVALLR